MVLQTRESYGRLRRTIRRRKKARVAHIVSEIQALTHPSVEVFFEDESHFTNQPYIQRSWSPRGQPQSLGTPLKREHTTLFGALHGRTQRFYWKRVPRGTARAFIAFLYQLHQTFPDTLVVLILDNSRVHTGKRVRRFLARHAWLVLYTLPTYAPEYNPIERFWKWLKETVHRGRAYRTMDQIIDRVRKLIWHYHENRLVKPIDFRFKPYREIL